MQSFGCVQKTNQKILAKVLGLSHTDFRYRKKAGGRQYLGQAAAAFREWSAERQRQAFEVSSGKHSLLGKVVSYITDIRWI